MPLTIQSPLEGESRDVVGFEVVGAAPVSLGAIGEIVGVYRQVLTEGVLPMALPQSAVSELLDAFRAGDGVDLIRDAVRLVLQELVELEATERIGRSATSAPTRG